MSPPCDIGRLGGLAACRSYGPGRLGCASRHELNGHDRRRTHRPAARRRRGGHGAGDRLGALEEAEEEQEAADRAAWLTVRDREAAARAAVEAEAAAQNQLQASRETYDRAAADLAELERQLSTAGAATPSPQLRTTGEGLVAGRVTSCYGSRSGAQHNGVDIAAPIGTPIYAPDGGVVLHAGTANGFGYAIYLQHPDGTITVYGHINHYFVSTGQVVNAGEQIAEVGNRGQSTGPHLHFETHTGGLFANRVNPVPWLAARGISLGCG
ncbi:M23 family peptidase [Blastococcus sp. TF02-8]|nr:M23 family peptidase [Blastococcus sp. TF02-8]